MNSYNDLCADGPRRRWADLRKKVVLTYDNTKMTDGAGAQLQRIYGIYSISRLLGATYLHSPLARVDYQGLSALEENVGAPGFHHALNDCFQIKSDVLPTGDLHEMQLSDISMDVIDQFVAAFDGGETGGRPILARIILPYGIADRFPDCYDACKEISPYASPPREGRALRVAVHVRRGELLVLDSDRMLPNRYYINIGRNVMRALEALGLDYQIELHTELPNKAFVFRPDHHGINHRISASTVVGPELCRLDEFDVVPKLVRCINDTTSDCLRKLATADILVMSRSSFSYLGGILNRSGIILYHPFWHAAPSSWMFADSDGQFDQSELQARLVRRMAGPAHLGRSTPGA